MNNKKRAVILLTLTLLLPVFLSACSLKPSFAAPTPVPTTVPTPVPTPAPTPEPTPEPYAAGLDLCSRHYDKNTASLDLRGISADELTLLSDAAPWLPCVQTIDFGDENTSPLSWELIRAVEELFPDAEFLYSFSLYGESMNLNTEYIDLRKIPVADNGEAVMAALPCMKKCTYLDMDGCGVDNEHMAIIRDAFPQVKVVWRVWFSTLDYSVRTDAKMILASLAGEGPYAGLTNEESCLPLTYCTNMKYLDLGHNNNLRTLNFLRYMPELEIFITYNNYLRDVDDLVYVKKLRYLELFGSSMYDIKAVAELPELTDLQLGWCYNLSDISPIIPADKVPKLRRLWLTPDVIPQAQIDEFQDNHPDCVVNTLDNSVGLSWRFKDPVHEFNTPENRVPEYQAIVDIFHYGADNNSNYNFSKNDPYYTTPHGQPVTGDQVEWFYGY